MAVSGAGDERDQTTGTVQPAGSPPEKKPRKERSDKGKKRGSYKGKKKTTAGKTPAATSARTLWLARKEAEIISWLLASWLSLRTGMQLNPPDETRREFLVSLIKQIEDVFPFNYIQRFLYQIFPVVDPSAKPTGSPLGDFVQYSMGWFEANPHLQEHAKLFAQMQLPWNQQNISGIPTHEGEQIYAAPVPFEEYQRLMQQPGLGTEYDPHDTGERQRG